MQPISIETVTISSFPSLVEADHAQILRYTIIPGVSAAADIAVGVVDVTPAVEELRDADDNIVTQAAPEVRTFRALVNCGASMTPEQYALWGAAGDEDHGDEWAMDVFISQAGLRKI